MLVELPLSLPVINTRPFTPESRDDTLHSGLLQLPAGTVVLVSDMDMEEGKMEEAGKMHPPPGKLEFIEMHFLYKHSIIGSLILRRINFPRIFRLLF